MIHIAICDDESQEVARNHRLLMQYKEEHPEQQMNVLFFDSPLELLTYVESNNRFDIVLLDIYMPGLLGTSVAQELRDMGDECEIIFLTSSPDHAIEAFSLNAAHYLLKPFSEQEFYLALDKVFVNIAKKSASYLTVKATTGIIRLNLDRFVYSESENHVQCIRMLGGEIVRIRKSSTELFELIEREPRFYKCGNTYIINMDYIAELTSKEIVLSTGVKIPMLSRKYTELRKQYMDYMCSR